MGTNSQLYNFKNVFMITKVSSEAALSANSSASECNLSFASGNVYVFKCI